MSYNSTMGKHGNTAMFGKVSNLGYLGIFGGLGRMGCLDRLGNSGILGSFISTPLEGDQQTFRFYGIGVISSARGIGFL